MLIKKAMLLLSIFILLLSSFLFSAHSSRTNTSINGTDVLVVQNQDPVFWFTDLAFNNVGIAHDTVGIQDFASSNISDYRIIVVGTQIGKLDQVKSVLDSKSPEIEAWIDSGGCIAVFGQYVNASVYDLTGALCRDLGSGYYRWLPSGPDFISYYSDYVSITNNEHPLMANLTDDDLSMWDTSGDGYFVSPPGETLVTQSGVRSVLYAQSFGNGKIVATSLDADYHFSIYNGRGDYGKLQARKLIENIMKWFVSTPEPSTTLAVEPSTYDVTCNEPGFCFSANIVLTNVVNLYGYELRLSYDRMLLELSGTELNFPAEWTSDYFVVRNEASDGTYWLAVTALAPAPSFSGNVTLATLNFSLTMTGLVVYGGKIVQTPLHLFGVTPTDIQATVIPHKIEDATITMHIALIGDLNGDGIVNIIDIVKLAIAYGSHPGDSSWNADCDLNQDGAIDIVDLVIIAANYGRPAQ